MDLFNSFKDTIFLKADSDLNRQLAGLKEIREKLSDTREIDKDIKIHEYGIFGENQIEYELKNAHIGMYVLHDVTFEYDGNKAQIDYLIFTRGYFYLIECKNLIGNVTVDKSGQFFREYELDGKKIKEAIYSPYTQALRHQDMLKKVWTKSHSKLDNFIFGRFHEEDFFKPLVVLANPKGFLNTYYAPKDIKSSIIRADQLISYIKRDLDKMKSSELSSEKNTKKAAEIWLSRSIVDNRDVISKYVNQMSEDNNDELIEKNLREFRKEKSQKMNIPLYYVFTDDELNSLIKNKPKTLDELRSSGILSSVKVKYHGKEILDILNMEVKK